MATGSIDSHLSPSTGETIGSESKNRSFFGTPPEPLFNHVKTGLCPELIRSCLQGLAKLNEKIDGTKDIQLQKCFRTKESVSFFIITCHHLRLPVDIQYRAIDLFVLFMTKHVTELYVHVQSTRNSNSPIDWETVQNRLSHQVTLRAITCIQLASKMSLHSEIVGIDKARSFLVQCGFRYAANSLVQSEIRVLKTLDFRVNTPTVLEYVEVVLEALGHNDPSIKVKQLHGTGQKILDVFYLCHKTISENLKDSIKNVTQDLLLVASAIVGTAAFVLDPMTSDNIIKALSLITRIQVDDILDLSAVLIKKIMTA